MTQIYIREATMEDASLIFYFVKELADMKKLKMKSRQQLNR
jgi:hypothetical protein